MILEQPNGALALLADGRAVTSSQIESGVWLDTEDFGRVSIIKTCPHIPTFSVMPEAIILAALTTEGRIYVGSKLRKRYEDITSVVSATLETPITDVSYLFTSYRNVVIGIGDSFTVLTLPINGSVLMGTLHKFSCMIDLLCFRWNHGLVKTHDGLLYWFGSMYNPQQNRYNSGWGPYKIEFSDVHNIRQVFCVLNYLMLHMMDGSIYIRKHPSKPEDSNDSFVQLPFPEGTSISRVITGHGLPFFITTEGLCYYSFADLGDPEMRPVLLQSLQKYVIENIFTLNRCMIIQFDDYRLCTMLPSLKDLNFDIFGCYKRGIAEHVFLSFFDNKHIVDIIELLGHTCFITDEGYVYRISGPLDVADVVITRDPFFDANPLAPKMSAQHIRSALSSTHIDA